MTFLQAIFVFVTCAVTQDPSLGCAASPVFPPEQPQLVQTVAAPRLVGPAVDVVLSAEAALAWDLSSQATLYSHNERVRRPIASLNKLLSALVVQDKIPPKTILELPPQMLAAQRLGANIRLPIGEHANAADLLQASMIPSANDAMVALAIGAFGSKEEFLTAANSFAAANGLADTRLANSTGLPGPDQYSTARDVRRMIEMVYEDPLLRRSLAQADGVLVTLEGTSRAYESTNQLLKTYVPIVLAKTGYTQEAGENLAIITESPQGQRIGAIILGSQDRFQDMKVLVEWVWRNYSWELAPAS